MCHSPNVQGGLEAENVWRVNIIDSNNFHWAVLCDYHQIQENQKKYCIVSFTVWYDNSSFEVSWVNEFFFVN